jgi:hypothetical protein
LVDLKFEHAQASASENSPVDEESTFLWLTFFLPPTNPECQREESTTMRWTF